MPACRLRRCLGLLHRLSHVRDRACPRPLLPPSARRPGRRNRRPRATRRATRDRMPTRASCSGLPPPQVRPHERAQADRPLRPGEEGGPLQMAAALSRATCSPTGRLGQRCWWPYTFYESHVAPASVVLSSGLRPHCQRHVAPLLGRTLWQATVNDPLQRSVNRAAEAGSAQDIYRRACPPCPRPSVPGVCACLPPRPRPSLGRAPALPPGATSTDSQDRLSALECERRRCILSCLVLLHE